MRGFTGAVSGNHIDLSPKYATIIYGYPIQHITRNSGLNLKWYRITNTFSTIPGIIGVYLTGFILQVSNQNWALVFLSAAGLQILAVLVYSVRPRVFFFLFDTR